MGNVAWLEAFRTGTGGVREFLAPFAAGDPPFIFSDGFPAGLLPRPLFPWETGKAADLASYVKEKVRRKAEFVRVEEFDALRRGMAAQGDPPSSPWVEIDFVHAGISRKTGTTGGEAGALFSTECHALTGSEKGDGTAGIEIYALCKEGWNERLAALLRDLSRIGFGRDKSIGLGQFDFLKMEPWDMFSNFKGNNGFIALSSFVPGKDDPTDGNWAVNVKYGKLGENAGCGNPFKRPFIQLKPGAVFYTGTEPKPYYGRTLTGLAPGFPDSIQLCYCLAVPCNIEWLDNG
jgi:CRISPR-associated protein Csm4